MKSFAIVIVCYNRLNGIKRLLNQLEKVDYDGRTDITLIFSIDKSNTLDVLNFSEEYKWKFGNKVIRTFDERQGLKNHIIQCGDYTNEYDIVTVLEDDIFVSNSLYYYAYDAACFYWDDENIAGISLYGFQKNWTKWIFRFEPQKTDYDTYFLKVAQSWGQVWTKDKWIAFKKWYSKNQTFTKSDKIPNVLNEWPESSWLKYHTRYCIENNKYFVYPYFSLSTNYSDPGEHATSSITDHQVELLYNKKKFYFPEFNPDVIIYDEYMEREYLGKYLQIPEEELTTSLWGIKPLKYAKRYILTTKNLPYKIIKSFSLSLRPIELSVMENIEGNGIYLYDSTIDDKCKEKSHDYELLLYSIRSHDYITLPVFSIKLFFKEVYKRSIIKIKKKFRL